MSFESFVNRAKDKLFRFSLSITGDAAEAQDVVQEVLIKFWNMRSEIQNSEAWCITLTRNLSLDKLRSKHRKVQEIGEAMNFKDTSASPYEYTVSNDTISQIRKWMEDLPEKQRSVMHLRDIEEMTYEEISIALNMPMDQVKVNLHRARTAIRIRILEFGI